MLGHSTIDQDEDNSQSEKRESYIHLPIIGMTVQSLSHRRAKGLIEAYIPTGRLPPLGQHSWSECLSD